MSNFILVLRKLRMCEISISVKQAKKLSMLVEQARFEIGHMLLPNVHRIEIKARYAAANKTGLALALFIVGIIAL